MLQFELHKLLLGITKLLDLMVLLIKQNAGIAGTYTPPWNGATPKILFEISEFFHVIYDLSCGQA